MRSGDDVPTLSLVVPVYCEEERFQEHADELAKFVSLFGAGSELVVVDDGSTDRTVAVVAEFAARCGLATVRLLHRPHLGKGAAVRAGLATATSEIAAFCDVDLSTSLEGLRKVVDEACTHKGLAIGSRALPGSRITRSQNSVREWLGRRYNGLLQRTLIRGIVDTQCGAKAASRAVWARLLDLSSEDGLAWDVELTALAQRLDIPIVEVPVEWAHDERSRVRPLRDGLALLGAIPRIRRRVRSVAHDPGRHGVFDTEQEEVLAEADASHWWFRSKAAFLCAVLGPPAVGKSVLVDLGAGAGGVTAQLRPTARTIVAVEGSPVLARQANLRHDLPVVIGLAGEVPLGPGSASVVTVLDVIEHAPDPIAILEEAARILKPGGRLAVTVPAHEWLWSEADVVLGHVRRYTRRRLREQLEAAGFRVRKSTHVFSWLVAPVWLQRRLGTSSRDAQLGLDRSSPWISCTARLLTRVEIMIVRSVSLPFGTSIIAIAELQQPTSLTPRLTL